MDQPQGFTGLGSNHRGAVIYRQDGLNRFFLSKGQNSFDRFFWLVKLQRELYMPIFS